MKRKDGNDPAKGSGYRRKKRVRGFSSFASGGTYILIPLLGIVLAFTLFYFAKDFFLGDEKTEYVKPDFAAEKELTKSEVESEPEQPSGSTLKETSGGSGTQNGTEKEADPRPEGQDETGKQVAEGKTGTAAVVIEKYQEDPSWGVQIAMVRSGGDARRLASRVEKQGFNVDITRPGDFYRVRIRGGSSRENAQKIAELLSNDGHDTLIVQSDGAAPVEKSPSPAADTERYKEDDTWGVQVGMLAYRNDAERLAKSLTDKGFNVDITRPGNYFRVRVRGGSTRESASAIEKLLADEGLDTLIVKSAE